MSDPVICVQSAVMGHLRDNIPDIDGRVYDFVNSIGKYPYICVSVPMVALVDEAYWDRSDISLQIDIWSDATSSIFVKKIASRVRELLDEQTLSMIEPIRMDSMRIEGIFYTREAQTLLNRARVVLNVHAQPL